MFTTLDHWLNPLLGPGHSIAELCESLIYGLDMGLVYGLLFFFLLRETLRKEWLAVCAFALFYTVLFTTAIGHPYISWLFNGLVVALFVYLLIRFGLLACVMMIFVQDFLRFPITFDPSAWYFNFGLFALIAIAALSGYGFYISIGGRRIVRDEWVNEGTATVERRV